MSLRALNSMISGCQCLECTGELLLLDADFMICIDCGTEYTVVSTDEEGNITEYDYA